MKRTTKKGGQEHTSRWREVLGIGRSAQDLAERWDNGEEKKTTLAEKKKDTMIVMMIMMIMMMMEV